MKYVASDGTIFDDIKEREAYEAKTDPITNHLAIYDEDLNSLSVAEDDIYENTSFRVYIHVISDAARVRQYIQKCGRYCVGIESPGIYMLTSNNTATWTKIDTVVKAHRDTADSLEAIKTGILQAQANKEAGIHTEG